MAQSFRFIPNYDDKYCISENGIILSFTGKYPHILKYQYHKNGYAMVGLHKNKNKRNNFRSVASLLLETWVCPKPSYKHKATFKDGDRTNLKLDNLEWTTQTDIIKRMLKKRHE